MIAESLKSDPQLSNREHARRTGADHKTVQAVRETAESTGEIPQSEERVSGDGRVRPASQSKREVTATPASLDGVGITDALVPQVGKSEYYLDII